MRVYYTINYNYINFLINYLLNKYNKNINMIEYKKIILYIFSFILDNSASETITKILFPLILPIYPTNKNYNMKLFKSTDNTFFIFS